MRINYSKKQGNGRFKACRISTTQQKWARSGLTVIGVRLIGSDGGAAFIPIFLGFQDAASSIHDPEMGDWLLMGGMGSKPKGWHGGLFPQEQRAQV